MIDSNLAEGGSAGIPCSLARSANDGIGGGIYNQGILIMLNTNNLNNSAKGGKAGFGWIKC